MFLGFFSGIFVGLHYLFFVGTYSHKRYNTQVESPESFECYITVGFMSIIIFASIIFLKNLVSFFGNIAYYWMAIPLFLNLIGIFFEKNKKFRIFK